MRRVMLVIALVTMTACQPPTLTPTPDGAAAGPATALPEPGVYVLQRVRGTSIPADFRPPGHYSVFGRVLGGRLYLTPQHDYEMVVCSDAVDSAGRVLNPGYGFAEGKYWATGAKVYISDIVTDAPPDSTAVRVRADTVEVVDNAFVLDRTRELPQRLPTVRDVCQSVRTSIGSRSPG